MTPMAYSVLIYIAFEFWDYDSVKVVGSEMMKDSSYPIDGKYAFYALLETQGSKQEHDQEVRVVLAFWLLIELLETWKIFISVIGKWCCKRRINSSRCKTNECVLVMA